MSSAATPPHSLIARKTWLATCIGVLLLHAAVGWALLHMPVVSLQPPKTTPPLEIAFVDLTPKAQPTVIPPEKTKLAPVPPVKTDSPPQPEPPTQQKTQAEVGQSSAKSVTNSPLPVPMPEREPISEPKPQPTAVPPTDVESLPDIPLADAKDTPPPEPTQVKSTPVLSEAVPVLSPETAPIAHPDINQQAILAAQQADQAELTAQQAREQTERERQAQQAREQAERERQAQQAREQAERERQAQQAREQAERERQAQQAREQAERERQAQQAREQAERERQAQQAQQPQTVTFGSGDARWRVMPKTNFTGSMARLIERQQLTQVEARLQISPQGDVTAVSIVTSSGNSQVDNALRQRLLAGKLYPHPTPRVGNLLINLN
ncbi:TonB C-terminal domain-containing protein [Moraxella atlantae]|uniref:TonB C-terminal domain-containing protein n=1 Tax=Faucicola atlantae TaxID=34059 RepID=UPI0037515B57